MHIYALWFGIPGILFNMLHPILRSNSKLVAHHFYHSTILFNFLTLSQLKTTLVTFRNTQCGPITQRGNWDEPREGINKILPPTRWRSGRVSGSDARGLEIEPWCYINYFPVISAALSLPLCRHLLCSSYTYWADLGLDQGSHLPKITPRTRYIYTKICIPR